MHSVAQQTSLFRSQIQDRCYAEGTIRILECILVFKDVESLFKLRSDLKQFMRGESAIIIREIMEEPIEMKLLCTDFLIRVFALIGDAESCLALRYEALVMQEQKAVTHPELRVSFDKWLTLAEHSLEKGFYAVANKACDNALFCFKENHALDSKGEELSRYVHTIKKIKRLKDAAMISISSQSVQSQASVYLRQKQVEQSTQNSTTSFETQCSGSSRFVSGIKRRNLHRLRQYQRM